MDLCCRRGKKFQSTLPQGERQRRSLSFRWTGYFNPRSHKGSDEEEPLKPEKSPRFQSTLPQGERPGAASETGGHGLFQSTLPQGERLRSVRHHFRHPDFNPRSHKGSDAGISITWTIKMISIHAPTRGATTRTGIVPAFLTISIHAPTRGATVCGEVWGHYIAISIHAPTRGATGALPPLETPTRNFNPRSHKGSDLKICHFPR